jgi:hypothetical protein
MLCPLPAITTEPLSTRQKHGSRCIRAAEEDAGALAMFLGHLGIVIETTVSRQALQEVRLHWLSIAVPHQRFEESRLEAMTPSKNRTIVDIFRQNKRSESSLFEQNIKTRTDREIFNH